MLFNSMVKGSCFKHLQDLIRKRRQKTFVMLSVLWPLRGCGGGGGGRGFIEKFKKKKFVTKIIFSDNFE